MKATWKNLMSRFLYHQVPPKLQVIPEVSQHLEHVAILAPHVKTYSTECEKLFQEKKVFFDNMVFEGTPLPEDEYIEMINTYRPELYVLPDKKDDPVATWELHKHAIGKLKSLDGAMAVAQGIPSEEYLTWVKEAGIKIIAVPYLDNYNRYAIIKFIQYVAPLHVHLLGIEHPSELYLYNNDHAILAADTTLAYTSAALGHLLEQGQYGKFKISDGTTERQAIKEEGLVDRLVKNIQYIKSINW